jgi:peptide-methionine (S)-S-oxide reductase
VEAPKKAMNEKGDQTKLRVATFGAGCFWCVEAVFQRLEGVQKVVSGYSGGHVDHPTYEQVCTGTTGHAEACQITYDPARISYDELLEVFWKTHDPTTRNRQGNDIGPQYRSVIFYHDEEQKQLAESYKTKLEAEHIWNRPIVTEIVPFTKFWPAESYHQNYYNNNPDKGYCTLVITPKVEKFRKVFKDKLK